MRKKILPIILVLIITTTLTGCNVKFIEKVEPEVNTKTSEDFGSIIFEEDTSSSTKNNTIENSETEEPSETTEKDTETENSETVPDGTFEYGGINFKRDESSTTLYCKEDCVAKISPSLSSKDYTNLKKGDFVTLKAISTDGQWAMVSIYGGPTSFVEYKHLTEEEIRQSQTINELETETEPESEIESETQEPAEENKTQENTQTPDNSSANSSTTSTTENNSTPENNNTNSNTNSNTTNTVVEDTYSGIPYPSNASSTSFNMGVEFADVNITLTIRKDGTQISNGPDKIANSTGYYSMGTLNTGETIKCTGIGRNGYVRVEYNGQIGFIDSKNTQY